MYGAKLGPQQYKKTNFKAKKTVFESEFFGKIKIILTQTV